MKIDLDAARAARREAVQDAPVVVLNGQELTLPLELPFEVAERLSGIDLEQIKEDPGAIADGVGAVIKSLLGDQYDTFIASKPSFDDLMVLIDGLTTVYGLDDLGESPASAAS